MKIVKNSTKEKMEVMQAFLDGREIEMAKYGVAWEPVPVNPSWNWRDFSYRVKPEKPSINWEHVADEYNFLSVDRMGSAYLYEKCPVIDDYDIGVWSTISGGFSTAVTHKSLFLPEGLDWEDSLVERPSITKGN